MKLETEQLNRFSIDENSLQESLSSQINRFFNKSNNNYNVLFTSQHDLFALHRDEGNIGNILV